MKIKVLVLCIALFFAAKISAQLTMHKFVHAGYVYQNQSFGEVGGRLLFLNNDDVIYRVGAAALLGSTNEKFVVMPKVQGDILLNLERNVDFYHSYYFLGGAEFTSKYIAPKVGATLFGILDVTGGYAIPLGNALLNGKKMKGFNLNVTLNIPIVLINEFAK